MKKPNADSITFGARHFVLSPLRAGCLPPTWRQRRGVRTTRLHRPRAALFVFSSSQRPPHLAPNVRDDRETPLCARARDGAVYGFDLGKTRRDLSLRWGLDR